ncbi:MAG TPA: hypothetical protein PKY77_21360 [Phycisphaerae bacterium]|nr:hypothetical protein [Phycisphaerae bacterium]HRY69743.1 hypothetical protein [Phycisphaerae bacterium]HSA29383.1 hypothetical protein [Phycisphaerae bacterium]
MGISVTDPNGQAVNRAKLMTFRPFDLGKRLVLSFVAWLATLGQGGCHAGGGGGGDGNRPGTWPGQGAGTTDKIRPWSSTHLMNVIGVGLAVIAAILAIGLLMT